jgi:hypothetical protein
MNEEDDSSESSNDGAMNSRRANKKARGGTSYFEAVKKRSKQPSTLYKYNYYLNRIKKGVHERLAEGGNWDDIDLSSVEAGAIVDFIADDSKFEDGKLRSAAHTESYRNALVHYYRSNKLAIPDKIDTELQTFLTGVRTLVAEGRLTGTYKAWEGKEAMHFTVFREIARRALTEGEYDYHTYLLFSWNMLCRSDSSSSVNTTNLSWCNDALFVRIPKSKSKPQGAERTLEHSFCIYANPVDPVVCSILSLGVKLVCTSMPESTGSLFRAKPDKAGFGIWFRRVANDLNSSTDLGPAGDFGTQSLRKGSLTYLAQFPGASSMIAGLLRGGYSIGTLLPRYIALLIQGDQSVGRTLCGLPPNDADSTLLPPRFASTDGIAFGEMVNELDSYPAGFRHCVPYFVASLVHHAGWLKETLPAAHPLFTTRFWRMGFPESLKGQVLPPVRMSCPVTGMRASGVTPYAAVMHALPAGTEAVGAAASRTGPAENDSAERVEGKVDSLKATLDLVVQHLNIRTASGPAVAARALRLNQAVTSSFVWPTDLTLRQLHALWYEGNPAKNAQPLGMLLKQALAPPGPRYRSEAKTCIEELNKSQSCTIEEYMSETHGERDRLFREACETLCDRMIAKGHKASKEALMDKFVRNSYRSLYVNDLKFLRK